MKKEFMKIHVTDNVAVALRDLKRGTVCACEGISLTVRDDIPFGHKIALKNFAKGENVIKYGYPIGHVTRPVAIGEHIHSQNLVTNLDGIQEYGYQPEKSNTVLSKRLEEERKGYHFWGYRRKNGKVGIRNEIWIIPLVGCVNKTAENLARRANREYAGMTDGFLALTHNMGCSQLGEDLERTQKILSGLVRHPNAGGVLVLSLGCENNQLKSFRKILGDITDQRIAFLTVQDVEDEYEEGMKILEKLVEETAKDHREQVGVNELVIGFKCGGSDAFSGIIANPLCGRINERVVSLGGTGILTEVPEMFGAEQILMNRASSEETFHQIIRLINQYKRYFQKYGQVIYENPSPGNKEGGITTLEEKSLGCVQKGGKVFVEGTLDYGEHPGKKGFYLLNGPGNDMVSCTNLASSGAQMILFTTGRGTPFGSVVPTVKIASNTVLKNRKKNWIDYNAGEIMEKGLEVVAENFMDYLLKIASGESRVQNEKNGFREISIFKDGVIM